MQYQVPQFIEVESKIVGPVSFRQFFILLLGASLIILYRYFGFTAGVFFLLSVITGVLTLAITFARPGGRSAFGFFIGMLHYALRPTVYFWKTSRPGGAPPNTQPDAQATPITPHLTTPDSNLQTIAQSFQLKKQSRESDPDTYLL
ncbi:MAG: hypothetical protein HY460_01955 [Parcubacteria group bacterium]|nr:hypothetical protein [Parcubacteria group bacterium]